MQQASQPNFVNAHPYERTYTGQSSLTDPEPNNPQAWPISTTPKRRYCCCFPTRRACCQTLLPITTLLLIGLGLAAFFLWPRMPTWTATDAQLGRSAQTTPNQPKLPALPAGAWTATILTVNLTISNPNYITVPLSTITVSGNLLDGQNGSPFPNATITGLWANLSLPPRTSSSFLLPVRVQQPDADAQGGASSLVLIESCQSGGVEKVWV
ncbi:hypothetical protein HK104_010762, partial [Borealophlyctis nickersoniae]